MRNRIFKTCLVGATLVGFGFGAATLWSAPPGGGGHKPSGGGGGGGGGFRGGSPPAHTGGAPVHAGGTATGGAPVHTGSAPIKTGAAPIHAVGAPIHTGGTSTPIHVTGGTAHAVGIHGGTPLAHGGVPLSHTGNIPMHGGHPGFGPGGIHDAHYATMLHSSGPHWNGYHQAMIGNHAVRLAGVGYRPSYYNHSWYHGPWQGYGYGWGWGFGPGVAFGFGGSGWGLSIGSGYGYGPYGYCGYPLGWGYGGWGLGRTIYASGYYPYYNPYYVPVVTQTIVYDYSRPIPVVTQTPQADSPPPDDANPPIDPAFEAARQAFQAGDYLTAQTNVDSAIARKPSDAVYHEFRALVLFARRDYKQAAATLHPLLAVGPGWDWATMSSLYGDPAAYTDQLRALERYSKENPQAPEGHFLLGYHYMIGGHKEASAAQLQQVATLVPNDRLAGELLRMVQGPPQQAPNAPNADFGANPANPTPNPPIDPPDNTPAAPAIDKEMLPGTWQATRADGSRFVLTMTGQGTFQWKYSAPNQKGDEFGGTYSTDGPVLILERKEGGALAGTATFDDAGHFLFKMVGAPPDDKGLSFAR